MDIRISSRQLWYLVLDKKKYHTTYEIDHKRLGKEDIDTYLVRVCTTYSTYDTQGRVKLLQWASAVSILEG